MPWRLYPYTARAASGMPSWRETAKESAHSWGCGGLAFTEDRTSCKTAGRKRQHSSTSVKQPNITADASWLTCNHILGLWRAGLHWVQGLLQGQHSSTAVQQYSGTIIIRACAMPRFSRYKIHANNTFSWQQLIQQHTELIVPIQRCCRMITQHVILQGVHLDHRIAQLLVWLILWVLRAGGGQGHSRAISQLHIRLGAAAADDATQQRQVGGSGTCCGGGRAAAAAAAAAAAGATCAVSIQRAMMAYIQYLCMCVHAGWLIPSEMVTGPTCNYSLPLSEKC
jgi:hypothetical protein